VNTPQPSSATPIVLPACDRSSTPWLPNMMSSANHHQNAP
jgi:hypothetical protein